MIPTGDGSQDVGLIFPHLVGNGMVALIYLAVFVTTLKPFFSRSVSSNQATKVLAPFSFLLFAIFAIQGTMTAVWPSPLLETLWLLIALLPGMIYFFYFHFRKFFPGGGTVASPSAKFDKLKSEFLSVASHELRTPLSVINGFGEILIREKLGTLNDEQKRRVRKILMQGQRLNRIIDELLDISRIRSGKMEVRKEVFDLVPVLKACLDDHQIVCEQQQIELRDEIADVLPDVVGDLERITQIIVNLLSNAIKYTEIGGKVTLAAHHQNKRKHVRVEIRDTGIGIEPDEQKNVFEEFYRADRHHTRKYSGSGLGLTIVQQLVEAQGGKVGLECEGLGKGCCFYFTIPMAAVPKSRIFSSAFAKVELTRKR